MIKKVISAISIALVSCIAMAQEAGSGPGHDEFNSYWFIQINGGAGYTVGETSFRNLISPYAGLSFGYRFTPVWGLRAGLSGFESKGAVLSSSSYVYRFNQLQGNIDVTADLCNIFSGYRPHRLLSPYLFAGIGINGAFNNSEAVSLKEYFNSDSYLWKDSHISPAGRFGAGMDIRICQSVHFNVECGANVLDDRFNSKKASNTDWNFDLKAGLTFNIGLNKGRKHQKDIPPSPQDMAAGTEQVVCSTDDTASVKCEKDTQETEMPRQEQDAGTKDTVSFRQITENIFFTIGNYNISEREMAKISSIITFLRHNPESIMTVTGYADAQTGSKKRNMFLSRKRAEAVAETVIYSGIDRSRISIAYKGDMESPYEIPEKNRVAVCVIKEK